MARWRMPSSHQAIFEATKKRAQKLEGKGKSDNFNELLALATNTGETNDAARSVLSDNRTSRTARKWHTDEVSYRIHLETRFAALHDH